MSSIVNRTVVVTTNVTTNVTSEVTSNTTSDNSTSNVTTIITPVVTQVNTTTIVPTVVNSTVTALVNKTIQTYGIWRFTYQCNKTNDEFYLHITNKLQQANMINATLSTANSATVQGQLYTYCNGA